jgi:hypothetical protein
MGFGGSLEMKDLLLHLDVSCLKAGQLQMEWIWHMDLLQEAPKHDGSYGIFIFKSVNDHRYSLKGYLSYRFLLCVLDQLVLHI